MHGPAGLSFCPVRDLTPEDIYGFVSSVARSTGGIDIIKHFIMRIFNVATPQDYGAYRTDWRAKTWLRARFYNYVIRIISLDLS